VLIACVAALPALSKEMESMEGMMKHMQLTAAEKRGIMIGARGTARETTVECRRVGPSAQEDMLPYQGNKY
jgi:hypothetical protein